MAPDKIARSRPLLGTLVEISINAENYNKAQAAITQAFSIIDKIERLLSVYLPESEISLINKLPQGRQFRLHPWTAEILRLSVSIWEQSGGLFDVVVPALGAESSSNDIILDDHALYLKKPLRIDLGGVGKGYAVDKAFEALSHLGFDDFSVSAGGDLRLTSAQPVPLYIRHPRRPTKLIEIGRGTDFACATSADYYRRFKQRDHGLYDPVLKQSVRLPASVSVIGDSCAVADALTKVAALKPEALRRWETFMQISID